MNGDLKAYQEARELQNTIATADGLAINIGIPGMHMILHHFFGYGLNPRLPLVPMTKEKGDDVLASEALKALLSFEKTLA
jgi:4-hydroxy-2-oxoglutarate aldolase